MSLLSVLTYLKDRFLPKDQKGIAAEYAILIALIAIAIIIGATFLGSQINTTLSFVGAQIPTTGPAAGS